MLESTKQNIMSIETKRLKICDKDKHLEELNAIFNDERTFIRNFN